MFVWDQVKTNLTACLFETILSEVCKVQLVTNCGLAVALAKVVQTANKSYLISTKGGNLLFANWWEPTSWTFPIFPSPARTYQSKPLSNPISVQTNQVWKRSMRKFRIRVLSGKMQILLGVVEGRDLSSAISPVFPEQVKGFRLCNQGHPPNLLTTTSQRNAAAPFIARFTFLHHRRLQASYINF